MLLTVLRQLAGWRQYPALREVAQTHSLETGDPAALPLLALAEARLGAADAARDWLAQAQVHLADLDDDARVDQAQACVALGQSVQAEALLEEVLARQPVHAGALATLADCRSATAQWAEARRLYQRALTSNPAHWQDWQSLAQVCLRMEDLSAAQQALDAAIQQLGQRLAQTAIPDEVLQRITAQLRVLQLDIWVAARDWAQAEHWLLDRRARLAQADWLALMMAYADMLTVHGRYAQAESMLRQARQHAPEAAGPLGALARLARQRGRELQAEFWQRQAETLAARQGQAGSEGGDAVFAAVPAATLPLPAYNQTYDPADERQRHARLRHAFSPALYQHRAGQGVDSTLPVFVVGLPGTGAGLAARLLGQHSEVLAAGPLGLVASRIESLNAWERRVGSGRAYPDCVDDLTPRATAALAEGLLTELRELAQACKPGARHVLDSGPCNDKHIGFIKFLFPRALIIALRRDPRDWAASVWRRSSEAAQMPGMGYARDPQWTGMRLADHHLLMRHWHALFPGQILDVDYEALVREPEPQLRRMLDHLGLPWQPGLLAQGEVLRTDGMGKWTQYREQLEPLQRGLQTRYEWEPITMASLPEPGLFDAAMAHYEAGRLDEAEGGFKKLLHHLPAHAAANFMVGLIYVRKGHVGDGMPLMEKALAVCPWNRHWQSDLARAREIAGRMQAGLAPTT